MAFSGDHTHACTFNTKADYSNSRTAVARYGALLVCFSRGQCIPPFHCSIVCSLSSNCLSEIWGGGCETKGNTHVRGRSHTATALIKFTTNWGKQLAHRVGLCRVVPHVNVGVIKSFFYRYAALGINDQHFGKQVPCLTCCYDNTGRAGLLWKQAYDIIKFNYSFWQLNIVPDGVWPTCLSISRFVPFYLMMWPLKRHHYTAD